MAIITTISVLFFFSCSHYDFGWWRCAALEAERADLRSRYGELQRAAEAAEQRVRAVQAERETMQRTLKEEAEKAAAAEAELQQLAQQKV